MTVQGSRLRLAWFTGGRVAVLLTALLLVGGCSLLPGGGAASPKRRFQYGSFSFSYDAALAREVRVQPSGGPPDQPDVITFTLDGYAGPAPATLSVYDLTRVGVERGQYGDLIRWLLSQRTLLRLLYPRYVSSATLGLPLPPDMAGPAMLALKLDGLDFKTGGGIRFITQLQDDASLLVRANRLVYTFQGITHDGQYYVAAVFPVAASVAGQSPPADTSTVESYNRDLADRLDRAPSGSYQPNLDWLDEVITSLTTDARAAPPASPTSSPSPTVAPARTATPSPRPPTATPTRVAPGATPTPAQAASSLCGQLTTLWVRSGLTAISRAIFRPCDNRPPLLVAGVAMGDDRYYRLLNPVIRPTAPLSTTEYGTLTEELVSWSGQEPLTLCDACNQAPPRPPTYPFSLRVLEARWQQPPAAFKPATLLVTVDTQGLPSNAEGYELDVEMHDFPVRTIHYLFDSTKAVSLKYMSASADGKSVSAGALREGRMEIAVRGLRVGYIPSWSVGNLVVTVQSKRDPSVQGQVIRTLTVALSDEASRHCGDAALQIASVVLGELPVEEAAKAKKVTPGEVIRALREVGVEMTPRVIETSDRIDLCGENAGCAAHEVGELRDQYLEALAAKAVGGIFYAKMAFLLKSLIEAGYDGYKCFAWLREFVLTWGRQNGSDRRVGVLITESPVYPLVIDRAGRRAGFLPDGRAVEEIPDSAAITVDDKHILLFPADDPSEMSLTGYADGKLTLSATLPTGNGSPATVIYRDLSVSPRWRGRLEATTTTPLLAVDLNADRQVDERRPPDAVITGPGTAAPVGVNWLPIILLLVAALVVAGLVVVTRPPRRAPARLTLVVTGPGGLAQTVAVSRLPFTIGRQPGCDLVLNDPLVSRQHAQITQQGADLMLEDRGSANGTRVNGLPIARQSLQPNDRIEVGGVSLTVHLPHP